MVGDVNGRGEIEQANRFALLQAAQDYKTAFPAANLAALQAHILVGVAGAENRQKIEELLKSVGWPLSQAGYSVIRLLYFAEGQRLSHKEVARALGFTPGNVTQLMNGLVKKQLVKRVPSRGSRRVTLACLTEKGHECAETVVPAMLGFMHETCNLLTEDETVQLGQLLRRYLKGIISTSSSRT